ncbi:hypothetical protein YERSI8AC_250126 [Enterobacterales bacterium 8AC]|nr:hypothetical protein YERSI8AC_250126 [Enterobacterales bacterium 8AC]
MFQTPGSQTVIFFVSQQTFMLIVLESLACKKNSYVMLTS